MIQTKESRSIRTIISLILYMQITGIFLFWEYARYRKENFLVWSTGILMGAMIISIGVIIWWCKLHGLRYGIKYAIRHRKMYKALRRALYESGIYTERMFLGKKCAILPQIHIIFNRDLQSGSVRLQNCIKIDKRLEDLPISSGLPGEYVLTAAYIADNCNDYIYEFANAEIKRLVFKSWESFYEYNNKIKPDELFFDDSHRVALIHMLIVGQTGSGKSYCLYNIVLQMLAKERVYELYVADPKYSGLYALGYKINKNRVAKDVDEIIALLRKFEQAMIRRKEEYANKILNKLDSDYRDFDLIPICLIIDEYSAFRATLARYDKKTRDYAEEIIGNVIREGRQLGCFCIIAQQQSNATNLPTELRENLPCKIILGQAERQTYMTALGNYPDVARRKYECGQGLMVYPQIASTETPTIITVPTLAFDIFNAVDKLINRVDKGGRDGGV